jgi:hypothetical protein
MQRLRYLGGERRLKVQISELRSKSRNGMSKSSRSKYRTKAETLLRAREGLRDTKELRELFLNLKFSSRLKRRRTTLSAAFPWGNLFSTKRG